MGSMGVEGPCTLERGAFTEEILYAGKCSANMNLQENGRRKRLNWRKQMEVWRNWKKILKVLQAVPMRKTHNGGMRYVVKTDFFRR